MPLPEAARATESSAAPSAATRILQATIRLLVERGAARVSLQDVAEAAGVSKGLIHYHYHDKDTLLTRAVEGITADLARRERAALAESTPRGVVDDLWTWMNGELRRGHVRALLELAQEPSALVREAIRSAAMARRAEGTQTATRLFTVLGLQPRVPAQLVAEVMVAFMDGLAFNTDLLPEENPRIAFDVFWLGILSLVE